MEEVYSFFSPVLVWVINVPETGFRAGCWRFPEEESALSGKENNQNRSQCFK